MPSNFFIKALSYQEDSTTTMTKLATLSHPVWLESRNKTQGRFDILSANPSQVFNQKYDGDPIEWADKLLKERNIGTNSPLPFCGGIIGCLGYEYGLKSHGIQPEPAQKSSSTMPQTFLGWYPWALINDHLRCCSYFVSLQNSDQAAATLAMLNVLEKPAATDFKQQAALEGDFDRSSYTEAFNRVQSYIQAGDCYQINLAQHYQCRYEGDPLSLYLSVRADSQSPYSAFIRGNNFDLLSFSPERFIAVDNGNIITEPIKGTAPRSANNKQDQRNAQQLKASPKDKAENLMIVDLLRNDLGKVCQPGSITVPALFELQSFTSVHHLVSLIKGKLKQGETVMSALKACFPGGSITGAPKHRAMQIINELEKTPRSFYCGTLFYASSHGRLDSNILIRSIVCTDNTVHCWGGGGLVADSNVDSEWQEIADKIGYLIKAIEQTGSS